MGLFWDHFNRSIGVPPKHLSHNLPAAVVPLAACTAMTPTTSARTTTATMLNTTVRSASASDLHRETAGRLIAAAECAPIDSPRLVEVTGG
jgi:hypothetical protein